MKSITSRQNPEIKDLAKLKLQKERKKQNKFVAEGLRVCKMLIEAGATLIQLYLTQNVVEKAKSLVPETNITIVSDSVMEKISNVSSPSGIFGVFIMPKEPSVDQLTSGLVLAKIADPGNMGTLIRSCAALDFSSIVIIEGADPFSPKVVQASAGTIACIKIFPWSWEKLIKNRGKNNLIALTVENGKNPQDIDFSNALLVIGSEAHGIPQYWIDDCQEKLTIPMPGKTESLNAAVAGSIALYLASTQKKRS